MVNAQQSNESYPPSPSSKRITLTASNASQQNLEDYATLNTRDPLFACTLVVISWMQILTLGQKDMTYDEEQFQFLLQVLADRSNSCILNELGDPITLSDC